MKLGLITDIHEHVEHLRTALNLFHKEGVDQIIVIGDVFEMGRRIEETCRLLTEARAIGVWGNHDFGLCVNPEDAVREEYSPVVIDYMTSLRPRLEVGGCYFSHVEPWLDPEALEDLWYFDGLPDEPGKLERIFSAVPNRIMFAGHYHNWVLAEPHGISDWRGGTTVQLDQGRYFVVIGALCEGHFAVLDTDQSILRPFRHC